MFINLFQSIFTAIMPVVALGAVGFGLYRKNVLDAGSLSAFSRVLVNIFLPSLVLHQFLRNFAFSQFPLWWAYPLLGFGIFAVGYLVSWVFLMPFKELNHKEQLTALITFQNSGYIPLLLVASLFSGPLQQELYVKIFLLVVGFNLAIWSVGVRLITGGGSGARSDLRSMLNPPFITTMLSMLLVYLGWHKGVPQVIDEPLRLLSQCALPVAMIIVGGNLAQTPEKALVTWPLAWTVLVKMILMPAAALSVVLALRLSFTLGFLIVLEFAVPSAVTLSIICRHYHAQDKYINHGLLLGHLLSVVTIPLFLALYFQQTGGH